MIKAQTEKADKKFTDVHTRHCCPHQCKYGEDLPIESMEDGYSFIPCTVVSGDAPAEYPCNHGER